MITQGDVHPYFFDLRKLSMVRNAFTGGEFMFKAISVVSDDRVLEKKWSGSRKVRDGFSPSEDPGISFLNDPGLTDQSQAADCDVNVIVDRFAKTGVLPGTDVKALYGDFSDVPTFQEALSVIAHAEEQFNSLDAKVRGRFDNDPSKFLEFVNDPRNAKSMVELGLALEMTEDPLLGEMKGIRDDFKKERARSKGSSRNPAGGEGPDA